MILFLGEARSHHFHRRVIAPSVHNLHPLSQMLNQANNAEELYTALESKGITHILLNSLELERIKGYPMFEWKKADRTILKNFWQTRLKELYTDSSIYIYEISRQPLNETKPASLPRSLDTLLP